MFFSTKLITIFTVSLALFMDVLDSNIINTAIPVMSQSFQVNPVDLKIALISYFLSLAIFIPISGWTADKYGTKQVFMAALSLFVVSSFWCGYASLLWELVLARFIQGIGAAFMLSLGRLIIARTFKRHELVEAMNAVIIVVAMAVMLGPFVGGVIVEYLSWPWIFWVNIPFGLFAMILAYYGIKDTTPKKPRRFDLWGFILFSSGLVTLCFALSRLSEAHVNLHATLLMVVIALLLLIIYVFYAKRKVHPVIKIELFSIRSFRVSVFGNLFARLGFGGLPFLLPLMQQISLGFSAQLSGLLLVPIAFGIIIAKLITIRILRRVGYRNFLISNTFIVGLVLWLFQIITVHTSVYIIATLTFIFGIFIAAQYTAMNSLAFADLGEDELSASTSITSTVQVLAQSFGVAIAALLLRFYSAHTESPLVLTIPVFHHTFFTMGILTFFSTLIFIHLKPNDGKQMLGK